MMRQFGFFYRDVLEVEESCFGCYGEKVEIVRNVLFMYFRDKVLRVICDFIVQFLQLIYCVRLIIFFQVLNKKLTQDCYIMKIFRDKYCL